jgi:hypothetical protein
MNHLRHAPETRATTGTTPVNFTDPIPATFSYARVKGPGDGLIFTDVPCVLTGGVTAKFRAYRPLANEPTGVAVDLQVAPDNVPLPPLVPDAPDTDPYYLKNAYIGSVSVTAPDGTAHEFDFSGFQVPVDLTHGAEVMFTYDLASITTNPIGPLLNLTITPSSS